MLGMDLPKACFPCMLHLEHFLRRRNTLSAGSKGDGIAPLKSRRTELDALRRPCQDTQGVGLGKDNGDLQAYFACTGSHQQHHHLHLQYRSNTSSYCKPQIGCMHVKN